MTPPLPAANQAANPNRDPREVVREEPAMRRRILEAVAAEPRSVPEIAEAIGAPAHEALVWVMGMRRYGYVREVKGSDGDGYFRYEPAGREAR
jgi:predicted Rossmann fold nucleotide-binding protein DprA/Smf involved in DNA uptake